MVYYLNCTNTTTGWFFFRSVIIIGVRCFFFSSMKKTAVRYCPTEIYALGSESKIQNFKQKNKQTKIDHELLLQTSKKMSFFFFFFYDIICA